MSTITSKEIITTMLRNKGTYPGDPPAKIIYSYTHTSAPGDHFAVFWDHKHDDMKSSPFVEECTVLFINGVLTPEGILWLARGE